MGSSAPFSSVDLSFETSEGQVMALIFRDNFSATTAGCTARWSVYCRAFKTETIYNSQIPLISQRLCFILLLLRRPSLYHRRLRTRWHTRRCDRGWCGRVCAAPDETLKDVGQNARTWSRCWCLQRLRYARRGGCLRRNLLYCSCLRLLLHGFLL